MSTSLKYGFYAFDFAIKTEVDCLLYFDVSTGVSEPHEATLSLDLSAHTSAELAQKAFDYFHTEYSIDIDKVSIAGFLNVIKIWAVSSASAFVHFSVVGK